MKTMDNNTKRKLVLVLSEVKRQETGTNRLEYIDVRGSVQKLLDKENHVVYGRRGSGKTALLNEVKEKAGNNGGLAIVIDSELSKNNTFPDIVIKVVVELLKGLKGEKTFLHHNKYQKKIVSLLEAFNTLLHQADDMAVCSNRGIAKKIHANLGKAGFDMGFSVGSNNEIEYKYKQHKESILIKIDTELRDVIKGWLKSSDYKYIFLCLDDYYLLNDQSQLKLIDYIHRLCKNTKIYFKVCTIKHYSRLYSHGDLDGATITGVQEMHDYTPVSLDAYLEGFEDTNKFIESILVGAAKFAGIDNLTEYMSRQAMKRITWAAGGVPRDAMLILLEVLDNSDNIGKRAVNNAAKSVFESSKRADLVKDSSRQGADVLNTAFERLYSLFVEQQKTTAFLVERKETINENEVATIAIINQLHDLRFIHQVVSSISANKPRLRAKRFIAYAFDIGSYRTELEIRKEGERIDEIDITKDKRDNKLRQCPPLEINLV